MTSLAKSVADEVAGLTGARVLRARRLHGGDINDAHAVALADGREVFVKSNALAPATMFEREAEGLAWLGAANALRVPEVLGVGEHALVLELISSGERRADFDEALGRGLARLHQSGSATFGFQHDNFIGTLPQSNKAHATWAEFYRDERVLPLVVRAGGQFTDADRDVFDRFVQRLPELVGAPQPSRLHGDLWGGNLHVDADGAPVLIDPAVYGGDREVDLAMMRLFGGYSERVFAAYDEVAPPRSGAAERVKLYQLYPLLVHANLFGGGYAASSVAAAKAYL